MIMSESPKTVLQELLKDDVKVIKEALVSYKTPVKMKKRRVGCACWKKQKVMKCPEQWKEVKISLSSDATFRVFSDSNGDRLVATIQLKDVINYVAFGMYTIGMPQRPRDDFGNIEAILALPEDPRTNGAIHWLMFKNAQELHEWLVEIASVALSPKADPNIDLSNASEVDYTATPRGIAYLRPFYKKQEDVPDGLGSESSTESHSLGPPLPYKAVAQAPKLAYGYGNPNQPYPDDDNYRRILMGDFDLERELSLSGKTKTFKKTVKPTAIQSSSSFHSI